MDEQKINLIIDFDSTFVKVEALDELASIALEKKEDKNKIVNQIKEITKMGMEGVISFPESLARRFDLLSAKREHVEKLIGMLKNNISESIKRNKHFFLNNSNNIYIISGGFEEYIVPVVADFGIKSANVLANQFIFDEKNNICGFNKNKPLAQENGKVRQLKEIGLGDKVWVIGDGYTDYQIKEAGMAEKFIAFFENVERASVLNKADHVVKNFDEFLKINNLKIL